MEKLDKRAPFTATGGVIPPEFRNIKTPCYILDEKVIHFSVKACPWVQVLKVLGGLIVTVTVMELTKKPLDALFNGHLFARLLRYTLTTFVASGLWPMTFRWFGKLSKEQEK